MEVQAWHLKWKDDSDAKDINTMPKILAVTNKTVFPNLFVVFQIGVTLPVASVVCIWASNFSNFPGDPQTTLEVLCFAFCKCASHTMKLLLPVCPPLAKS